MRTSIYFYWIIIFASILNTNDSLAQKQENDFYQYFKFSGLKGKVKEISYFWYTPNPKDSATLSPSKNHVSYTVHFSTDGRRIKETMLNVDGLISSILLYNYQIYSSGFKVTKSNLKDTTWKQLLYYSRKEQLLKSEYFDRNILTTEGLYQYNEFEKLVKFEQKDAYSTDGWFYTYGINKCSKRKYLVSNSDTTLYYKHELIFNSNNNIVERNEYNPNGELETQYLNEYDDSGFVTKEIYRYSLNIPSKTGESIGFYKNEYDDTGNLIKQTSLTNDKKTYLIQVRKILYY